MPQLKRVSLPHTDLQVSHLSLGTANYGINISESEAFELIDHYVACGGNFIDTARVYSDWIPGEKGRCERILGDWLKARGDHRDDLLIATKGMHYEWSDKSLNRVTYEAARHDIEKSLQALGLDTIGLYYLHRDNPQKSVKEIIDFLQVFIDEGKVRHLGVANWEIKRIEAANAYAKRTGKQGFVVNQPLFSLGSWNIKPPADPTLTHLTKSGYDYHRKHNMVLAPYSSQSQGFFTKALGETEFDEDQFKQSRFHTRTNLELARLVKELAASKDCNANGVALAYLFEQPFPIIPVVGCNSKSQLDDSIRATNVRLSEDELQALENTARSTVTH